ncbi:MAG TPA: hypothetical protein PLL09_09795 [Flavobacterium sp.]|uniref:hypothetical protein n=1 Tax=unclassified Flavobacterium TaxID=196869 RepID=UPI0025B83C1A|nr:MULTISPECIES: hypothetical protein [unclassified Flavobacterium]HRE78101.1 hypothetical protein [Flavobacterium sp.]
MDYEKRRKIKSQKNAAILLIIVPFIIIIRYISKNDFDKYGVNNYIICSALFVLMICGGIGLKNSLSKQRELDN